MSRIDSSATGSEIGRRWHFIWRMSTCGLAILTLLTGCARQDARSEIARLFETTRHDLGEVRLETEYPVTYRLLNSTTRPICIQDIKSSCGCVSPQFDPEPIPPGAGRDLTLTLSTKGVTSLGPLVKHAWIRFDNQQQVELELLARLEPEIHLEPRELTFSADQPEQKLIVERRQLEPAAFAALSLLASTEHYDVREDGSARSPDRREFLVRLRGMPAGASLPTMTMANSLSNTVFPFSTVICSRSGPTLRPSAFVVVVTDASALPPPQRFELFDPDSRPLRILDITADGEALDPLLHVEFAPKRDQRSFSVALASASAIPLTRRQLAVTFEADDGTSGRLLLPCHVIVPAANQH